ncbi:MAG: bifunctional ornithine acetyltransferase/N-acetylglutamate synthase, partial [Treponema sp.]|nr:bifunctional ornithine acetyltransferase/N-acetylglutamate synthase [Treponema sp.]
LAKNLSKENHKLARLAIMTTDTQYKEYAVRFSLSGKTVTIGAMCKGSGMIHINMGTMLSFITTDCAISRGMLEKAFRESVEQTYNCVSIDGDTSTNDTALILANGMAENEEIVSEGSDYDAFFFALNYLNTIMAKKIAADGEGASRLIECCVSGAKNFDVARSLAKSVISSNLVKAAIFGSDANWGRILCALGYSGQDFLPEKTTVSFASKKSAKKYDDESLKENTNECNNETLQRIVVFKNGVPLNFDEDLAKKILQEEIIYIFVDLDEGSASVRAWGCDLTYDYVKINGDYRT